MTSRDLVKQAIHFGRPARIPLVYREDPARGDFVHAAWGPRPGWQPPRPGEDEFGCLWWDTPEGLAMAQVKEHPLAGWSREPDYVFPDPHIAGRFDAVRQAQARYPDKYIAGTHSPAFFLMSNLRGFAQVLEDLYAAPDRFHRLAERVDAFDCAIYEEYVRCGVDGVLLWEDWGTQRGLMIRPAHWREVFKPRYAAQFRYLHDHGVDVIFHSCGNVWDIIPDLIEIGVDVLNLEQPRVFSTPECDGIDRLAQHFGRRVCFCTNVDSQTTLIHGSRVEIEAEAAHVVAALGFPEGGLLPLADCTRGHRFVPHEHVDAMAAAFERLCGSE